MKKPLLFEIGLEELPTKEVLDLSIQLKNLVEAELDQAKLEYKEVKYFGTPRRLAILVEELAHKQADYVIEKKGPAEKLAFDESGNPTKALEGFMKSNNINFGDLQKKEINGIKFMVYIHQRIGELTTVLMPELLSSAVKKLAIQKPMRWGDNDFEFVRPIHWLCLMYGDELIKTIILNVATNNRTYGHRFHAPKAIELKHANNYIETLETKGYVIVNFDERKQIIRDQIYDLARANDAIAVISEELLNEVTALVEWPVALMVDFDERFLQVPEEALISAMQTHQKVFHLITKQGTLIPKFITVANIESKNEEKVIQGNARVMRARLADAAFFFATDCKSTLESRLEKLKHIVFQKQLGNLYQRAERIAKIAKFLAPVLHLDETKIEKAGLLAKTDLVSNMVEEFPELQGTMGYHYAINDGLDNDIAMGIRGQYMPRFAEDELPSTDYGSAISLADRIDKLVGIFGINQPPSGMKDPFGLRRAAIGLLTIVIEKKYRIDLKKMINYVVALYGTMLTNPNTEQEVFEFIMERLKNWYQAKQIKIEFYNAVYEKNITELSDFNLRLKAVKKFSQLPEAESLAAANKRVSNILAKENIIATDFILDNALLTEDAEKILANAIQENKAKIIPLVKKRHYTEVLKSLVNLREPIDRFFDEVMVMVDDNAIKNNRIALLISLRSLFLEVADISKL